MSVASKHYFASTTNLHKLVNLRFDTIVGSLLVLALLQQLLLLK